MSAAPTPDDTGAPGHEAAGTRVGAIYASHGRAVYGLCRLLLHDPHDAEDASQATFLSAHRALLRGNEPRDEGAWITTIARNECRARIRERMLTPTMTGAEALEQLVDPAAPPGESISDPSVRKALVALPESQREAVVLHDLFGLRAREVGAALGLSLPAVEALLFRARRQLRTRLHPVAGALSVPLGLRDSLSHLIPGFVGGGEQAAGAAAGAAGVGLLAKLLAAPTAAKLAAGAVAVGAGSVVAVEATAPPPGVTRAAPAVVDAVDRATSRALELRALAPVGSRPAAKRAPSAAARPAEPASRRPKTVSSATWGADAQRREDQPSLRSARSGKPAGAIAPDDDEASDETRGTDRDGASDDGQDAKVGKERAEDDGIGEAGRGSDARDGARTRGFRGAGSDRASDPPAGPEREDEVENEVEVEEEEEKVSVEALDARSGGGDGEAHAEEAAEELRENDPSDASESSDESGED